MYRSGSASTSRSPTPKKQNDLQNKTTQNVSLNLVQVISNPMTQREKVIDLLKTHGFVSRNELIDNRTTIRLGAIIEVLRNKEGYKISGRKEGSDFIYWLEQEPHQITLFEMPTKAEAKDRIKYS